MNLVIIGASHAGISLAEHLKKNSFRGKITIIESTNTIPVEKPPLSKKFLDNDFSEENILIVTRVERLLSNSDMRRVMMIQ